MGCLDSLVKDFNSVCTNLEITSRKTVSKLVKSYMLMLHAAIYCLVSYIYYIEHRYIILANLGNPDWDTNHYFTQISSKTFLQLSQPLNMDPVTPEQVQEAYYNSVYELLWYV